MSVKPEVEDIVKPLRKGSARLHGWLGKGLNLSIENRLKKVSYPHLVDPFRFRDEADGRWRCEFWGKIVRSTILSWRGTLDPELLELIRSTVFDLISTQTPDGCISSYPYDRQTNDWDIWGRKYVLLGLLRYYLEVNPDERVKNALVRELDYLMTQVAPDKLRIIDCGWHDGLAASSILEPVTLLYRVTGEKRFLEYALWIEGLGCSQKHNIFNAARDGVAPEDIGNGKAYEMMSCFEGLAELYRISGGKERMEALLKFYDSVRDREIFITGVGGLKDWVGEYWFDGKLKQTHSDVGGLGETCVITTWAKLCAQMLRLTGDSTVADQLERTLYNGVLGAMKPDGSWWAHINPTPLAGASSRIPAREQMQGYGEDCCLAQGPTAIAIAPYVAVMQHAEGPVVNFYEDASVDFGLPSGEKGKLEISGGFPKNGNIKIELSLSKPETFTMRLRIPEWSQNTRVRMNRETVPCTPGTYLELKREWHNADKLEIEFDMCLRVIPAFDGGDRVALLYGPIVLAQDSRLGEVDAPVAPGEGKVVEAPEGIRLAYRLPDDTTLCDYASAGNLFDPQNTLCVWMQKKR